MRDGWLHDVRQGLRVLHRGRAVSVTSVIVLALGIGASTALYTVLDSVLMEPLPYPDSERITSVDIRFTGIGNPDDRAQMSPPEFADLRRFEDSFAASTAYASLGYNLRVGELPERISGAAATPDFWSARRAADARARFRRRGRGARQRHLVVLGHAVWQRAFQADPRVIGRSTNVNGNPSTVIGVMPGRIRLPRRRGGAGTARILQPQQLSTPLSRLSLPAGIGSAQTRDRHSSRLEPTWKESSAQIIEGAPETDSMAELNFAVLTVRCSKISLATFAPRLTTAGVGAWPFVLLISLLARTSRISCWSEQRDAFGRSV